MASIVLFYYGTKGYLDWFPLVYSVSIEHKLCKPVIHNLWCCLAKVFICWSSEKASTQNFGLLQLYWWGFSCSECDAMLLGL